MICGRKIADIKGNRSDGTASVYIVTCLDITQCNSQMIICQVIYIYMSYEECVLTIGRQYGASRLATKAQKIHIPKKTLLEEKMTFHHT